MAYLRNCWYMACWTSELGDGAMLPRQIAGERVVVCRGADGVAFALKDRCSHRFAPLSKGRLEDGGLRCMYHGLKFSPEGQCVAIPGQDKIPQNSGVQAFSLSEAGGWIWIWLGAPEAADPALIPEHVALDDSDWAIRHGVIEYSADYMLVNDNLLDFSHLSYVHAASFGAGAGWAETRPEIVSLPRGVRIERWLESQPRSNSRPDITATTIDHWSRYDYVAPGMLHSVAYSYPVGTAALAGSSEPGTQYVPLYGLVKGMAGSEADC